MPHPPNTQVVQSREADLCGADRTAPDLDPTLSGMQRVAAKNMAPRFLGLPLRMAMSVRWPELKRTGAEERLGHFCGTPPNLAEAVILLGTGGQPQRNMDPPIPS